MIWLNRIRDFIFDPRFVWNPTSDGNVSVSPWVKSQPLKGYITFDVEENYPDKTSWGIGDFLKNVGKILDKRKIKATFFVQGELISQLAEVLKRLSTSGHEIGVHGYTHENWGDPVWFWGARPLSKRAKEIHLDSVSKVFRDNGLPVPRSFRAPNMNINSESLNMLKMYGYRVDSSYPSFRKSGCKIETIHGLKEVPVTSLSRPVGGIVKNFMPLNFCNLLKLRHQGLREYISNLTSSYFVFLAHPWEFYPNNQFSYCSTNNLKKLDDFFEEPLSNYRVTWKTMND